MKLRFEEVNKENLEIAVQIQNEIFHWKMDELIL